MHRHRITQTVANCDFAEAVRREIKESLGEGEKNKDSITVVVTDSYLQSVVFQGSRETHRRVVSIEATVENRDPQNGNEPAKLVETTSLVSHGQPPAFGQVELPGLVLHLTVLGLKGEVEAPQRYGAAVGDVLREMLEYCGETSHGVSQLIVAMGAEDLGFPGASGIRTFAELDAKALAVGLGITTVLVQISGNLLFPPTVYIGARPVPDPCMAVWERELMREVAVVMKELPIRVLRYLRTNNPSNPWGGLEPESLERFQIFDLFGGFPWGGLANVEATLGPQGCQEFASRFKMLWTRGKHGGRGHARE